MKKLLLLSVILLAACNKQDEPSVEPSKATIIPYVKEHHAKSDPPAQLDFLQLVQGSSRKSRNQIIYFDCVSSTWKVEESCS